MSYNRKNKLLQIKKVIEIYQREKKPGIYTIHIYKTFVYPVYPISRATFYNYLSTPVNRLLKEIDSKEPDKQT